MPRKFPLVTGQLYHIFNRSIANFVIFNAESDYQRMLMLLAYFQVENQPSKFSYFIRHKAINLGFYNFFDKVTKYQPQLVQIIAYCLMPTHIHLVLKQHKSNGISVYLSNVQNAYARYFNTIHKRKGPLWEGQFKNVLISTNEQLLHLTRYFHLNPTTAGMVDKPGEWKYSSYLEYCGSVNTRKFCDYADILEIQSKDYQKFVEDYIGYQKELSRIKKLTIDL